MSGAAQQVKGVGCFWTFGPWTCISKSVHWSDAAAILWVTSKARTLHLRGPTTGCPTCMHKFAQATSLREGQDSHSLLHVPGKQHSEVC